MRMICNKHPRVTGRFCFREEFREAIKHIRPILIVQEYLATLYARDHDVMQNTRSVNSS